jgi:hypothetical protein
MAVSRAKLRLRCARQERDYFAHYFLRGLEFALPDRQSLPAECFKFATFPRVALDGRLALRAPKFGVRSRRHATPAAVVRVPEASVYKYHFSPPRKREVGLTRQIPPVQTEPIPGGVQTAPQDHLGLGVLTPDATHVEPSLFNGKHIDHSATLRPMFPSKADGSTSTEGSND